jgi:hypothetical protein
MYYYILTIKHSTHYLEWMELMYVKYINFLVEQIDCIFTRMVVHVLIYLYQTYKLYLHDKPYIALMLE